MMKTEITSRSNELELKTELQRANEELLNLSFSSFKL